MALLDQVGNFKKVNVSTGYDNIDVTIILSAGEGAELPDPTGDEYNLVWWDATTYDDPADDPNVEIVRVTALATDTLTVTRAQEGSLATTKNTAISQYKMLLGVTAKMITDIETCIAAAGNAVDNFTIKEPGSILEVANWIPDNVVLNSMKIASNHDLGITGLVDGLEDTFTDETGISSNTNATFEGGSYLSPEVQFSGDTVLLMNLNDTQGSLEIADSSGLAKVVTQVGGATLIANQKHTFTATAEGSLRLNGIDQYLTVPDSSDFAFGTTGDYSFDLWFKRNEFSSTQNLYHSRVASTDKELQIYFTNNDSIQAIINDAANGGAIQALLTAQKFKDNDWHHLLYTRSSSGTVQSAWVDGYQVGYKATATQDVTATGAKYIGSAVTVGGFYNGYIDDFRISNTVRFSAAPIPQPAVHLTLDEISGVVAFTDGSVTGGGTNYDILGGGSATTMTSSGKVRYAYDFNGADHLRATNGATFASDTTGAIMFWMKFTGTPSNGNIFSFGQITNGNCRFGIQHDSAGHMNWIIRTAGSNVVSNQSTTNPAADVWTHVALVQDGTAVTWYFNGVAEAGTQSLGAGTEWVSTAASPAIVNVAVGAVFAPAALSFYNGQIDDVRYYQNTTTTITAAVVESIRVAGVAGIYGLGSVSFTPPSADHTDDINTMLLLPFDTTTQGNDLVDISSTGSTVHVVSSVEGAGTTAKFGTAYMSFPNTSGLGADYLSVADSEDWDVLDDKTGDYTIGLWARSTQGGGTYDAIYWVSQRVNSDNRLYFSNQQGGSDQYIQYFHRVGGTTYANCFSSVADDVGIQDTNWHYLTFSKVGIDMGIYKNGTQIAYQTHVTSAPSIAAPLEIGAVGTATLGQGNEMAELIMTRENIFSATPSAKPTIQLRMNDNLATTNVINTGSTGNDGTANANTSALSTTGKLPVGTPLGFQFDGAVNGTRVNVDSDIGIKTNVTGAFSFWANPTAGLQNSLIFTLAHTVNDIGISIRMNGTGNLIFSIQDTGPVTDITVTTDTALTASVWTHVVISQDGVDIKFYYDGVLQGKTVSIGTGSEWFNDMSAAADTMAVGGENAAFTATPSFDGILDDFRYYQNELSQAQVDLIYNSGAGTETFLDDTITVPTVSLSATSNTKLLLNCIAHDASLSFQIPDFGSSTLGVQTGGMVDGSDGSVQFSGTEHLKVDGSTLIPANLQFCNRAQSTLSNFFVIDTTSVGDDNMISLMGVNLATDFQQFGKIVPGPNSIGTGFRRAGITAVGFNTLPNTVVPGRIHHLVFTKNDGHYCMFLDGVQVASDFDPNTWSCTSGGLAGLYIGQRGDSTGYFPGKLDDCFMTDDDHFGVAGVHTPCLITGDGDHGDTTASNLGRGTNDLIFTGSILSKNAPTGPKLNANTSMFFVAASSQYINVDNDSVSRDRFNIGGSLTTDWTIDCWVNPTAVSGIMTIASQESGTSASDYWQMFYFGGGTDALQFIKRQATVNETTNGSGVLTADVWQHVAFCKVNADVCFYVNGIKNGSHSTWTTTHPDQQAPSVANTNCNFDMSIGRRSVSNIQFWDGYIEQFRMIQDNIFNVDPTSGAGFDAAAITLMNTVVAAATLTIPTAPHVPDANTMFNLALQPTPNADWFLDTAPTPNTFIVSGTPHVTGRFGSGCYNFDGTGDHIAIPMNKSLEFLEDPKEDVTLHFWLRHNAVPGGTSENYFYQSNAGFTERFIFQHNGSVVASRLVLTTANGGTQLIDAASGVPDTNWHHMAIVGIGSESETGKSWQGYRDGTQILQGYQAFDSLATINDTMYWGSDRTPSVYFTGQMDGIQIVRSNIFNVPVSVSGDVFDATALTLMNTEPELGATSSNIILISTDATVDPAEVTSDTVKLYIDLEDIDPTVILNTDITAEVTRLGEGAATWVSGTLVQTGQATNGRRLVSAKVDVSGNGSPAAGASLYAYRITTANDVRVRLHATTRVWG